MRVLVLQVTLFLITLEVLPITTVETLNKRKRSPLELGFVTFPNVQYKQPFGSLPATITSNESPKVSKDKVSPSSPRQMHPNIRHEWIPGHVHHHSYIPAHVHHVLIPAHALLLARTVHVLVPEAHKLELYNPYRSHYGGFGIGVDNGGQGAGHGFHAVYNF